MDDAFPVLLRCSQYISMFTLDVDDDGDNHDNGEALEKESDEYRYRNVAAVNILKRE